MTTETSKYFVLSWDANANEVITRAGGDASVCQRLPLRLLPRACLLCATSPALTRSTSPALTRSASPPPRQSPVGQPTDAGQLAIVDPNSRVIALRIYPELIHIVPINKRGQLQESFDVR